MKSMCTIDIDGAADLLHKINIRMLEIISNRTRPREWIEGEEGEGRRRRGGNKVAM